MCAQPRRGFSDVGGFGDVDRQRQPRIRPGSAPVTGRPSLVMVPAVGHAKPARRWMRVLLPQPLWPSPHTSFPSASFKHRSATTSCALPPRGPGRPCGPARAGFWYVRTPNAVHLQEGVSWIEWRAFYTTHLLYRPFRPPDKRWTAARASRGGGMPLIPRLAWQNRDCLRWPARARTLGAGALGPKRLKNKGFEGQRRPADCPPLYTRLYTAREMIPQNTRGVAGTSVPA
jgi:hypothetical protein